MGKMIKFCSSCDESFAEKFVFCPNCAATLDSFEMNPVAKAETAVPPAPAFIETSAEPEPPQTVAAPAVNNFPEPSDDMGEIPTVVKASPVVAFAEPLHADAPTSLSEEHSAYARTGDYYVTVIEETNLKQRNSLLLGTLGLMIVAVFAGLVINIFSKDLQVASISDDIYLASLIEDVPVVEEEMPELKKDKDGGGGGGGGNEDPEPVSKGERAPMRTEPEIPPSARMEQLTNPTIPIQPAIKGPFNERLKVDDRYGYKLGGDNPSDGPGVGGGQGTGRNGGQGPGSGPGYGPGSNGGLGGGNNGGLGPGGGRFGDEDGPPPRPTGVTSALQITSKPRPGYTDAARQNNIQGTVILRVTFLGSGQIGSISTVKGLPNGLTEQAIAAARRISFIPKKIDGIGQTVTRQIEYTFSIY
jgi:TonB family protein